MGILDKISSLFSKEEKDSKVSFENYEYNIENKIIFSMLEILKDLNSRFNRIVELNKRESYVNDKNELNSLRLNESYELLEVMRDLVDLTTKVKDYIYEYIKEIEGDPYMNSEQKYNIKMQIRSQLLDLKRRIDNLFVEMEVLLQRL